MKLAFDTETSGLPKWDLPSDHADQPHLVQLAMILLDDDLKERASVSVMIRPEGWTFDPMAQAAHGISVEMADAFGIPERLAAQMFASLAYGTGASVVAHNAPFDLRIMRTALLRAGYSREKLDGRKLDSYCTMKAATPILNLPPTPKMKAAGRNHAKSANLGECIRGFFGEELEGAHDALVDVRACVRVYRHLMSLQAAQEPPPAAEDEVEETV